MVRLAIIGLWFASACLDTPPSSGQPDAGVDPDQLLWQRGLEQVGALVATHEDDPILVGSMKGDEPFEPAPESSGTDLLIARLREEDGTTVFAGRHGDDVASEAPLALAIEPDGAVVAAGIYGGGAANLTGVDLAAPGFDEWHAFFAAYDSTGAPRWSTAGTGGSVSPGGAMFVDGNADLRVGGTFTREVLTIEPEMSPTSPEGGDGFVANLEGNNIENTAAASALDELSATGDQAVTGLYDDGPDDMYVVGVTTEMFSIGGKPVEADGVGTDLFVVRQTLGGSSVYWTTVIGGTKVVYQPSSATTSDGDLIVAAAFTGEITIEVAGEPATYTANGTDVIVARLDRDDGTVSWVRKYGGPLDDLPTYLAVGPDDQIALTGRFRGVTQFGGADLVAADRFDGFVALYGPEGTHLWSLGFGGDGDDSGYGVAFSSDGALYLSAVYAQQVDFGGEPLTSDDGVARGVLVKLQVP